MPKVGAIVAAAGLGTRMGTAHPKQFISIAGKPVLAHTLEAFERCPVIETVCLVVREQEVTRVQRLVTDSSLAKVTAVIPGGEVRQDSVYNGLLAIDGVEIVVVHDGVRPLVLPESIAATVEAARDSGAATLATKVSETVKAVHQGLVLRTIDRGPLWMAQTPQAFRYRVLREAHERARAAGVVGTDDAMLVERLGHQVRIVQGPVDNLKISTAADLALAEAILAGRIAADAGRHRV
ncbi:MAG TPA: 2-C-methyl-D-erythritol 4-phosphate cytidylyltransferase [bacterium]|nr:2-C-methyl-D-erythritol 4-phosphate cytidylyltransferase [bacterium]